MFSGKEARLFLPDELPPEFCFGKSPEDVQPTPLAAPRGLKGLFSEATVAYQPLDLPSLPSGSVLLNVYDVGDADLFQKINRVSTMNDTVLIGGVYHAGVEVYGVEWSYGFSEDDEAGVSRCIPRTHPQHTYRATVNMGCTELHRTEVEAALLRLTERWRGPDYSLIHHNCLDFCNAFCKELGVGRIPGWVDRFGRTASSIDNISQLTIDGISRTKQLARTVSRDLDNGVRSVSQSLSQEMEHVVSGARREMPRLAEASLENVQALGAGIARWSQGLFGAAARALGDDPRSRPGSGGDALRTSLRNRGGVRASARRAAAELGVASPTADGVASATTPGRRAGNEEADDPFLLDELLEEQAAADGVGHKAVVESTVAPAEAEVITSLGELVDHAQKADAMEGLEDVNAVFHAAFAAAQAAEKRKATADAKRNLLRLLRLRNRPRRRRRLRLLQMLRRMRLRLERVLRMQRRRMFNQKRHIKEPKPLTGGRGNGRGPPRSFTLKIRPTQRYCTAMLNLLRLIENVRRARKARRRTR